MMKFKVKFYNRNLLISLVIIVSMFIISIKYLKNLFNFKFNDATYLYFSQMKIADQSGNIDFFWSFNLSSNLNSQKIPVSFHVGQIYHHDGVAYDFYSQLDLNQPQAANYWKQWAIPYDMNRGSQQNSVRMSFLSPARLSGLPFVNQIYVISDIHLKDRHKNLEKAFERQGLDFRSIQWRTNWTKKSCNDPRNHEHVYQRLNLIDKPLNKAQQLRCALAMKHVEIWHEIAEHNMTLALILEDDAIFVPFFKEKFARMIYQARRLKMLHFNEICISRETSIKNPNEQIDQEPIFVIGSCFNFHGDTFDKNSSTPIPLLSTHKASSSRCTHAYLLTSCSAKALIEQIHFKKNEFWPSDFMQNNLVAASPKLQAFWMDPPLVYQGNQVIDLDQVKTFRIQTYLEVNSSPTPSFL